MFRVGNNKVNEEIIECSYIGVYTRITPPKRHDLENLFIASLNINTLIYSYL